MIVLERTLKHNESMRRQNSYYGVDTSDSLQHWKYIKRYKGKNGKWRYIYNTGNKSITSDLSDYVSRLTGNEKHWYKQSLDGTEATDDTTGYSVSRKNGVNSINLGKTGKLDPFSLRQKTNRLTGVTTLSTKYQTSGKTYVTKTKYKGDSILSMKTRNLTVDTNVERTIEKGKNFLSSLFKK